MQTATIDVSAEMTQSLRILGTSLGLSDQGHEIRRALTKWEALTEEFAVEKCLMTRSDKSGVTNESAYANFQDAIVLLARRIRCNKKSLTGGLFITDARHPPPRSHPPYD
jgi:hypothetical protein